MKAGLFCTIFFTELPLGELVMFQFRLSPSLWSLPLTSSSSYFIAKFSLSLCKKLHILFDIEKYLQWIQNPSECEGYTYCNDCQKNAFLPSPCLKYIPVEQSNFYAKTNLKIFLLIWSCLKSNYEGLGEMQKYLFHLALTYNIKIVCYYRAFKVNYWVIYWYWLLQLSIPNTSNIGKPLASTSCDNEIQNVTRKYMVALNAMCCAESLNE